MSVHTYIVVLPVIVGASCRPVLNYFCTNENVVHEKKLFLMSMCNVT